MATTLTRPREELADDQQRFLARRSALVIAGALALLVCFQIALALGAPLGRAAWGGKHTTLPTNLRIATVVPVAIYALGAVVVLQRAGYLISSLSHRVAHRSTWVFGAVLVLSALANAASSSDWERFLMAPVALALGLLTFVVARSSSSP